MALRTSPSIINITNNNSHVIGFKSIGEERMIQANQSKSHDNIYSKGPKRVEQQLTTALRNLFFSSLVKKKRQKIKK